MRLYQFHVFDARGETALTDLVLHDDDDQACIAAIALLAEHRSAAGVQIHDVDRLMARLDQPVDVTAERA